MSRIGVMELLIIGLCGLLFLLTIVALVFVLIVASNKKRTRPATTSERAQGPAPVPPAEAASTDSESKAPGSTPSEASSQDPADGT